MLNQNKENQLNNWLEESVQNNKIPFGEISISKENKNIYNYKIYTQDEKYKNMPGNKAIFQHRSAAFYVMKKNGELISEFDYAKTL